MRLFDHLDNFGDRIAFIDEAGTETTYRQLLSVGEECVHPLEGSRKLVAFECANDARTISAYVACLKKGHVPILVAPPAEDHAAEILRTFAPAYTWDTEAGAFERTAAPDIPLHQDLALLLSTSGSTGSPKLVRLSHENLRSNADAIAQYLEFAPGERGATCLPMQYSYGMSVVNAHLSAGHSLALTERSVSDAEFWTFFKRAAATNFQGVPYTFELLARTDFADQALPALRHFTQAGGRLSQDLAQEFAELADRKSARFYIMYGQTEASPRIAYVPPEDIATAASTIGIPIPGGSLTVESEGAMVPDGEEGELVYTGANVMMGYATEPSHLDDPAGPDILHTGDIAVRQSDGYFRITGRASRFIKPFGLRIGLDEVERKASILGATAFATGTDERLVVALDDATTPEQTERVSAYIAKQLGLPPDAYAVFTLAEIPRLPTGKPDYKAILSAAPTEQKDVATSDGLLAQAARLLRLPRVDGSRSFVDLEGDSLTYVKFAMMLEDRIGELPANWEKMPLDALAALDKPSSSRVSGTRNTPMDIVLRALLICLVVLHHATAWPFSGSAQALLVVAGYNFARFQLPQATAGKVGAVLGALTTRVLLPYILTLIAIFAYIGAVFWPSFLLSSNYFGPIEGVRRPTIYWFIESYIVLIAFFTLAMSWSASAKIYTRHPLVVAGALLAFSAALRAYGTHVGPMVPGPDFDPFAGNTPLMLAVVFVFGWFIQVLQQHGKSLWAMPLLAYFWFYPPSNLDVALGIFTVAVATLILVPSVRLPRRLADVLFILASASLYIYISQSFVFAGMRAVANQHLGVLAPAVGLVACLGAGIAMKLALDYIAERRDRNSSDVPAS